jgi:hypothetical protein
MKLTATNRKTIKSSIHIRDAFYLIATNAFLVSIKVVGEEEELSATDI